MKEQLKISLIWVKKSIMLTLVLMLTCGFGYPLLMTGLAQMLFPHQANGSMATLNGQSVGSELVGQDFTEDYFMKCRPSAVNYNTYTQEEKESGKYSGVRSGSDNYAPTNPDLVTRVQGDIANFLKKNPQLTAADIPTDLMTASGSGLDPHISPASAAIQIESLVSSTGLSVEALQTIVENNTTGKLFGIFGEECVNVLGVNLEIAQQIGLLK